MKYVERKRLLLFGLPWTFTKYTIAEDMITVNSGLLKTREDDCYMYKVVDTRLSVSLAERIFGLGTVHCFGGDTTDPALTLSHIKHAKEIKEFIRDASENERMKRRTMRTQDIAHGGLAPEFPDMDNDF